MASMGKIVLVNVAGWPVSVLLASDGRRHPPHLRREPESSVKVERSRTIDCEERPCLPLGSPTTPNSVAMAATHARLNRVINHHGYRTEGLPWPG